MKNKLEELRLEIEESGAPDRDEIDFSIYSNEEQGNICWVWGKPDDYEVECNHVLDYDDMKCPLCGRRAKWHEVEEWEDDGHDEEGKCVGRLIKHREIDTWEEGEDGGLVEQYIMEHYA